MKYVNEYRNASHCRRIAEAIRRSVTRPWTLMEMCGGQTHAIVKYQIDKLLPESITLVHGPGCPVCVTPIEMIDKAIEIAERPDVIFCAFGDMMRVPGSKADLLQTRAAGADVRMVYSPLDAVRIARENPEREVVFFAVGFETTAPVCATAAWQAHAGGVENFSLLVSHVLVPPAIEAILASEDCRIQGFLAAGHVCTVMGYTEYEPLAERYGTPIAVTGFEPVDILRGIEACIAQLEAGRAEVENCYARAVQREGNRAAQEIVKRLFRTTDRKWRGIGEIPRSGLTLREEFRHLDAEARFGVAEMSAEESPDCISGQILLGARKPSECPAFAGRCTPEHPLGATMVSSEGACAAYYRYRRDA